VSSKLVQRAEKIKQARKSQVGPIQRDSLTIGTFWRCLLKTAELISRLSRRGTRRCTRKVWSLQWSEASTVELSWYDNARKLQVSQNLVDLVSKSRWFFFLCRLFPRPTLSSKHVEQDCIWKRPSRRLPVILPDAGSVTGRDIIQDNLSDCSVVASLIVSAEHHAKFGSKVSLQNTEDLQLKLMTPFCVARYLVSSPSKFRRLARSQRLRIVRGSTLYQRDLEKGEYFSFRQLSTSSWSWSCRSVSRESVLAPLSRADLGLHRYRRSTPDNPVW